MRSFRWPLASVQALVVSLGLGAPAQADAIPGEYIADALPARGASTLGSRILQAVDFELESYLDAYWSDPTNSRASETSLLWWNRLSGSAQLQLFDRLSADVAAYVSGTLPNQLRGAFTYPGEETTTAPFVDVTTFALRYEQDAFDILLGKAPVDLGVARLFSPSDRFNRTNINNPLHSFDLGRWQATVNAYWPSDTMSFSILPFDERDLEPPSDSRWLGPSGDSAFFDLADVTLPAGLVLPPGLRIEDEYRSRRPEDWGYLVSYQAVREGYDFYAAAHYGPGAYPTIEATVVPGPTPLTPAAIRLVETRTDSASVLGGVTATFGQWNLYGEGVYQRSFGDGDQSFLKLTGGVTYNADDLAEALDLYGVTITAEYSHDVVTHALSTGDLRASSAGARPFPTSVLGEIRVELDADLELYTETAVNLDEGDHILLFGFDYNYTDDLEFVGQLQLFGGPLNTQFGRFRDNDSVYIGTRYSF